MPLWNFVPSWFEIENRVTREMGFQGGGRFRSYLNEYVPSIGLNIRRVESVRSAFNRAEWQAADALRQRFADLDISSILTELLGVVNQMAMIVVGSVVTGGGIGAGIGAFAGGGVGAIPVGAAGAAMGLQASTWMLAALGLVSVAEFFVEDLPRIGEYYLEGISIAWEGPRGDEGLNPFSSDDPFAQERASHYISKGHEEVVVLLLGAIVAYLTRGRGGAQVLAHEMRTSSKGARLGQWILKHEDALKKRSDLQVPEPRSGKFTPQQSPPPPPRDSSRPGAKKTLVMPEHKVPCFNASNMPASKIPEFDRQLAGQQQGLNELTVAEYLRGREAFTTKASSRNPKIAADARRGLSLELETKFFDELLSVGALPDQAMIIAKEKASQKMATLAALHNPDLVAGGKDIISTFGDRRVNSSIGPQWPSRISGLDTAATAVPEGVRSTTKISAKLERCK
ncbi:DUF6861 domain-containing protein [Pseudomonas sp. UM16]|uniref:DUF6861 domain-containing protein n=1 Tax=Pseudomonas sp. UM16 TaxID=3158962 RepID=UPI00398FCF78